MGALDGFRVLDLTRLLPGGFCSWLLGDLGAEVIKVEEPGRGDYLRWFPPLKVCESGMFLVLSRNKKSLTLNLKTGAGKAVFRRLAEGADVVLEGYRPGVMDRLGLGWKVLHELNPRLVYCAITGYGQDGPYRDLVGHDLNYLGVAGALELMGERGRPPIVPGLSIADLGGGAQMAAVGILGALLARGRTGEGQFVDISMTDGVVAWLSLHAGRYFTDGVTPRRGEMALAGASPCYQVYECADGRFLTVGCIESHFWKNLCVALGVEEYVDHQWSEERREEIFARLRAVFLTRPRDDWFAALRGHDICVGPSSTFDEAFADPQLVHRGMVIESEHPVEGRVRELGPPIKLSGTPAEYRMPAPRLGEHNDEILRALGYEPADIAQMASTGVI
jgi:crotonobetainyl-CoA:carnitine CoA-transferase CaiB-like acyl-CoA transferase